MNSIEDSLGLKLAASPQPGSENRITLAELREWVLEYLREWDEEVARFPELAAEPHWNLWMADYDRERDAMCVGMIFGSGGIEIACGTGNRDAIRQFGEDEFPEDLHRILPELRRRLSENRQTETLPRTLAESWLGRSFPPAGSVSPARPTAG
jgi:hypothetical protein